MRFLLLIFLFCISLFSVELTPIELQIAENAGYSKDDINNVLATKKNSQDIEEKKEQIVENNFEEDKIEEKKNFFETSSEKSVEEIERFGSLFFDNKNTLNPYSIPTPSNYNLSFGDKLSVTIFGGQNQKFNLNINKDGNITIPQVGEIKLIGLSFAEAKKLISDETKKAYPNSTNILVDISEFTSIQITISGLVNAPGLYNLSSFSTIKDALVASGSILSNGSYRNIYLKRNGDIKKVFDLYELVRYGNTSSDLMLQNGDVILVKPIEKEILLTGDINYNARFELKRNESFKTLINYSAGFKPSANKNAIKLKRYENGTLKVYSLSSKQLYKMTPKSGDEVHVYSTSTLGANLVEIVGNIVAEGERELPKDKKLSTLLNLELKQFGKNAYFKNDTNYTYAAIRNDNTLKSFNLQKILDKKDDISLKIGDQIIIYKNDELQEKPYIYAEGLVVDTATQKYDFFEGMRAQDLFDIVRFKSDMIVENERKSIQVDKTKVQISRVENNKKMEFLIKDEELKTFLLKKFDDIKFFEYASVNNINTATIKGEVFIPGMYNISSNIKLKDLVKIAGGFTKKVTFSRFEIARYSTNDDERTRSILSLNLKDALEKNIKIHADDEITIFPIAKWNKKMYVELKGLVKYPGKYPIIEGEKLSSVIQRAGGFLSEAFIEGAVFTREEVKELQIKRLEQSIDRIKARATQASLVANEAGETTEDKQNILNTVKLIEKENSLNKPIGRITIELYKDLEAFKNSKYDITLKDKDALYIPSLNDTVSVVGEVLNQTTFVYDKNLVAYNYLEKAGGVNDTADTDMIYIVKANGEAIKVDNGYFWNDSGTVYKGDTIIVPLKLDIVSDMTFVKDVSSVLYQFAVTAAALTTVGAI